MLLLSGGKSASRSPLHPYTLAPSSFSTPACYVVYIQLLSIFAFTYTSLSAVLKLKQLHKLMHMQPHASKFRLATAVFACAESSLFADTASQGNRWLGRWPARSCKGGRVPIPVCVSMECPDFPPSLHTMHAIYTHHARAHTHATEHLQLVERHGQHVQAQLIHAFIAQGVAAEVHLGEAAECE
eukprot:1136650-Pelagomonas_calceolata.AAC.3